MKRKVTLIILTILAAVVLLALSILLYVNCPFVIYPTHSSAHTLTVVSESIVQPKKIYIKSTVNGKTTCHVLDFKMWLGVQETQWYELPLLEGGEVEVIAEMQAYDDTAVLSVKYDDAKKLYINGLLLYGSGKYVNADEEHSLPGHEHYVYFVSGCDKTCYLREAYSSEWNKTENAPKMKAIEEEDEIAHIRWFGDRKHYAENKWETITVEE